MQGVSVGHNDAINGDRKTVKIFMPTLTTDATLSRTSVVACRATSAGSSMSVLRITITGGLNGSFTTSTEFVCTV